VLIKGNTSVRISQISAGIVLAFMAITLYRTSADTIAVRTANDTRTQGTSAAQRETVRVERTLTPLVALRTEVEASGYDERTFISEARAAMLEDPMVDVVDYFDADDSHIAHVEAGGRARLGQPRATHSSAQVSPAVVRAVNLVLSDSYVTRVASASHALRVRARGDTRARSGRLYVYVALPLVRRSDVVGTVVARIDVQRLLVDDVAAVLPLRYVLDDGSGMLQIKARGGIGGVEQYVQNFSIPFADRAWSLTVAAPPAAGPAKWWLFMLLWLVAWLALCVPIEVVGQINRRVRVLNEGLEARVAARTRQLEASVAEAQTLAAVVESVHEGVMLIDQGGTVRYANDALCRELGCTLDDLLGKAVTSIAPVALSRSQLDELSETVHARGFAYLEIRRTRTDGEKYWAGITLTRHGGEEHEGMIAVSRDVTDRRHLVDELVLAKDDLERQMRVSTDFIGTASHELRTPVTTLRTLSTLLGRKVLPRYAFSEDDAKLLGMLDFETRRLASLVDDLLEVAKVDAIETPLAERDVDIRALVRDEAESTFGLDTRAGPPVELRLSNAPACVRADEHALRRVIVNLIGNARKFTPPDGRVTVSVDRIGEHARLVVSDTGIGIPEDDLPHVFERFYRVARPRTEIRGTGLGLAIVARLVERMRGAITISSKVGQGTTVTVELPIAPAAAISESA